MKKKTIAAAALSLALAPCICLFACSDNNNNGGNKPEDSSTAATVKLDSQVTGTKDTYKNIYGRAERNGGLFSASSQKSAAKEKYALAEGGDGQSEISSIDTNALIAEMLNAIKSNGSYTLPNNYAVQSYVLDVFAYTQIARQIIETEGKEALTKNYSVNYDIDDEFTEYMKTDGNWYPNIPEEMSFAGFDDSASKVNLVFKARQPYDKRTGYNKFETVNSEMYYISDDNFGYAQFTYRNANGQPETGFNYFSMKDKAMLEINMNSSGKITYLNTYDGTTLNNLSAVQQSAVENCLASLETVFKLRTLTLEQQNLALAVQAGIEGVESKQSEGESVYIKANSQSTFNVTFDYDILKIMKG